MAKSQKSKKKGKTAKQKREERQEAASKALQGKFESARASGAIDILGFAGLFTAYYYGADLFEKIFPWKDILKMTQEAWKDTQEVIEYAAEVFPGASQGYLALIGGDLVSLQKGFSKAFIAHVKSETSLSHSKTIQRAKEHKAMLEKRLETHPEESERILKDIEKVDILLAELGSEPDEDYVIEFFQRQLPVFKIAVALGMAYITMHICKEVSFSELLNIGANTLDALTPMT